jgi:hypothetical protein
MSDDVNIMSFCLRPMNTVSQKVHEGSGWATRQPSSVEVAYSQCFLLMLLM